MNYPAYCKFLYYGSDKQANPHPNVRIFNKVGDAYGFLLDNAYVVDFEKGIEFMVTAVILCNEDEVFNDEKYDYDTIGYPFFKALGQHIYNYESTRKKAYVPRLDYLKFNHENKIWVFVFLSFSALGQGKIKAIGIVQVSVGNVRSEPAQSAEMSTQVLMGTPVKLLEKAEGKIGIWFKCRMNIEAGLREERSRGWIRWSSNNIKTKDQNLFLPIFKETSIVMRVKNRKSFRSLFGSIA